MGEKVAAGELPMNHEITYQLQDIFNLLPDVTNPCFVRSLQVNTNDQMLVMYMGSLIRSVIALHNLINNKLANKEAEKDDSDHRVKTAARRYQPSSRIASNGELSFPTKSSPKEEAVATYYATQRIPLNTARY